MSRPSAFASPSDRDLFADDVLRFLGYDIEVDGRKSQGASLSFVRTSLSSRQYGGLAIETGRTWRGASRYWNLVDALREAGFRVERGRTYRHFRGGVYAPGQACDVVTL